jgi:hypothetical protein
MLITVLLMWTLEILGKIMMLPSTIHDLIRNCKQELSAFQNLHNYPEKMTARCHLF